MSKCGSVIRISTLPAGVKRGGRNPIICNESSPSPCNCVNPCCYGAGRSFCWPCMKNIMSGFVAVKKV